MTLESQSRKRIEDPGAELVDRVTGFWSRYARIVLGAVGVAAAAAAIGFFTMRAGAASEEQAAGQLAEANVLFWQGDYPRSLEIAKQVYGQYGSTESGRDAHRIAGDNAFWMGDFQAASEEYARYLDGARGGPITDAVRRSRAYALESLGQSKEAAPIYESLVGVFDRESSAEFLSAAARCREAAGEKPEAERLLRRLLDEFGETTYAVSARIRLAELSAR